MKITSLSVRRPVAMIMAVLIFVVLGVYSVSMMEIALMPDIDFSMALVVTSYSNVGPTEVENLVTKTIESAVSSVSGLDAVTSMSSEGNSIVLLQFVSGTDMNQAVADIKENIDLIEDYLPQEADDPIVLKMDMSAMPIAMMSVSYEGYDMTQTKKFVEDNLESKLEAIDGVASVAIRGARDRIIDVVIDPEKVFGYGVTMSDVASAIAMQNQNLPVGSVETLGKELTVRTVGKFSSVDEIGGVPLMTSTGQIIYLRDIAQVNDTYSDVSSIARLNGEDALSISITGESDANTVNTVNAVIDVLESLAKADSRFSYNITMEQASYIENAINSVAQNAILGGLLAVIVLLLFLGSVRRSLVVGISMPVSIVTTFIAMYFSGMTLNVVSLGGLALGVGMLVDNSVVVIENIYRRRHDLGEDSKTSAIMGASEVIGAVVASVLTTCIVYVPILFIKNMMAEMFRQLAFAIIFSQAASLMTTFLLIPMISSRIKKDDEKNRALGFILNPFERFMNKLYAVYEKLLRKSLGCRKRFVAIVLVIFIASLGAIGMMGMSLMPASDQGTVTVTLTLPDGSPLEDADAVSKKAEAIIEENPYADAVFSSVGGGGMMAMLGLGGSNSVSITVSLSDDRDKATSDVAEDIRASLSGLAGAEVSVSASSVGISYAANQIEYLVSGPDDDELADYARRVEDTLASIEGITETSLSIKDTKPEVKIYIDKAKAALYGLNTYTATSLIKAAVTSTTAARYSEGGSEYDIVLEYPENYVTDLDSLRTMRMRTYTGQWIAVGDIAALSVEDGYTTLYRMDRRRIIDLTASYYGSDMFTIDKAFREKLESLPAPHGATVETDGAYDIMMDAMKSLFLAILLGILLMYMVMAAQFEDFIEPLIILGTLPLALIGVALGLVVTRSSLSVVSMVGILMLIGIVVNNAIILIDFVNTERRETPEKSIPDVLVSAGRTRLRPILMTSLTSILGFLPMAVSRAAGSEMMRPLAIVLCGGLTVSTFLTLLVIPVIYSFVESRRAKKAAKKAA